MDGDIVIEKEIQRMDTTTPDETKGETDAVAEDTKEDVKSESGSEMETIESTELKSQNEGEKDAVAEDTKEDVKSESVKSQNEGEKDAVAEDTKGDVKPESMSETAAIESTELPTKIHVVEKESNATSPKLGKYLPLTLETIEIVDKKETTAVSEPSSNSKVDSSETTTLIGSTKILKDAKGNAQKTPLNNRRYRNNYRKIYRSHKYWKNSHNCIMSNIDSILHQRDWMRFNAMRPWLQ
ncbi:hypothetical protein ACOME3_000422 [Neoechinorhynchus agilis]